MPHVPHGKQNNPEVEQLIVKAAEALNDGVMEDAIANATRALEKAPRNATALALRAQAHAEMGELAEAERDMRQANAEAPDDPEVTLAFVEFLVFAAEGDHETLAEALTAASKARKRAAKSRDVEVEYEFLLLEGTIFNQLGESSAALEVLDLALKQVPDSVEAKTERALALFELCRFADAHRALEELLRIDADDAWAHHHLGMLYERSGDEARAKAHFTKAEQLDPEGFLPPIALGDGEFDRIVEDALARLPEDVKQFLENVTLAVEPFPAAEDLLSEQPPLSPAILGVFRGVPVGERSVTSAADHVTSAIVLYQRNLERFARTREELIEQIGITVMHEVGHLVGLDEDDLRERGLD